MRATGELLLDAGDLRLLDGIRLVPRRVTGGRIRGDRLTRKKGVSIEFADFRDYVDGDDVRHLDWNVLARMQTPVIRTYLDEEDLAIYVLLDCSQSMEFGSPQKLESVKKIAAAISYLALSAGDALHLIATGLPSSPYRALRGRANFLKADSWINQQTAVGETPLAESLHAFAAGKSRSGLAFIISDGLDPRCSASIAQIAGRGHEVAFIQILSPEETDPDIEGDLRLIDCENGSDAEITATGDAIRQYRRNLEELCATIAATSVRYGGRYMRVSSQYQFDEFVKNNLRRDRWVA